MREPLFDVMIPDNKAKCRDHYQAGDGEEKILIILQAYDNVVCQENIRDILGILAANAGIRLVAVENADTLLKPDSSLTSVRDIIRVKEISSGVLSALNAGTAAVEVWGVDNMAAITESYKAMNAVRAGLPARNLAFNELRPWLRHVQAQLYPDDLARALSGRLLLYESSLPIDTQAASLSAAAAGLGSDLKAFPALWRLRRITETVSMTSDRRVKRQLKTFLLRLTERLHGWHKRVGKNEIGIDIERVQPIMEYWLETTGQPAAEIEQRLHTGGAEPVFLALNKWIEAWLVEHTLKFANGPGPLLEELMRLALRLEVPFFDLPELRRAVVAHRDTQGLKEMLLDEFEACSRWLVEQLGSQDASAFYEAEHEIDLMYRALGLALSSADSEGADISGERLMTLVDDIAVRVKHAPAPGVLSKLRALGPCLAASAEFLRLSAQRSRHMVERMLDLMHDQNADRLALVIGGFHQRAITRALEDHRHVSWSVILPALDLKNVNMASFWG